MRVPELKSPAGDWGLRNCSRMRKAEFVAFWPFGFELLYAVQGKIAEWGKSQGLW